MYVCLPECCACVLVSQVSIIVRYVWFLLTSLMVSQCILTYKLRYQTLMWLYLVRNHVWHSVICTHIPLTMCSQQRWSRSWVWITLLINVSELVRITIVVTTYHVFCLLLSVIVILLSWTVSQWCRWHISFFFLQPAYSGITWYVLHLKQLPVARKFSKGCAFRTLSWV